MTHPSQLRATPGSLLRFSVLLGLVGGILDLGVGLLLLLSVRMSSSGEEMGVVWSELDAILLLILGGAVLATAIYSAATPMPATRRARGAVMLVYGILMLFVGGTMLGGLFPMIRGSDRSGVAMIVVGLGMLYSGATMGTP